MRRIRRAVVVAHILSNRLVKLINILQCILRADQQCRISRDINAFFFVFFLFFFIKMLVYVYYPFFLPQSKSYHRFIYVFIRIIT